ncbi:MAG: hypothetical protein JWQ40_2594 [Segetibacter sp.]|nr:hypothetical protein [Segetibacter sp.]
MGIKYYGSNRTAGSPQNFTGCFFIILEKQ